MTEGEKCSGKPWDGSGSDWFSVRTLKTLLIGQSVTSAKYERTAGSWREKERAYSGKLAFARRNSLNRAAAMSENPKNHTTRTGKFAVVAILSMIV